MKVKDQEAHTSAEEAGQVEVGSIPRHEAGPQNPARIVVFGGFVLVALALFGATVWASGGRSAPGNQSNDGAKGEVEVGALAPDFTLKEAKTGQPIELSSLRGKPVWINFWATWCEACREEMPLMQTTYAQYKDKGLRILGINMHESTQTVNAHVSEHGYDWTFLIDPTGAVFDLYWGFAIPTHWFIDKGGVLKATHVGAIPEDNLKEYLAKIAGQ